MTTLLPLLFLLRTVQNEDLGFPAKDVFTAVTGSVKNCPKELSRVKLWASLRKISLLLLLVLLRTVQREDLLR